jgi:type II secretory pathway pseudopilin PulG
MLTRTISSIFAFFALVALIGPFQTTMAQRSHLAYQHKYDSGQTIQPIFQGWSKNEDGTFDMHFGYLNRNYSDELHIPIGADNSIDMAGLDNIQNQPTYFQTRNNRDIFTVNVPADFGNGEIVWRLTTEGQTLEAVGWLQSEWEIDEFGGYEPDPKVLANQPPQLSIVNATSVRLPAKLTLTPSVTDDGLPKPEPKLERTNNEWNTTPLLSRPEGALPIPTNVGHLQTNLRGLKIRPMAPEDKLTVSYTVWRGPANIVTQPIFAEASNGSATTEITFTEPGEYQLQVRAFDGGKSTYEFVTVNVQ